MAEYAQGGKMRYVLGIDFGGGSSKATLLNEKGIIIGSNTVEYKTAYPQNGYAEQNPEEWFQATLESIRVLLDKYRVSPETISAIAFDAATHTAVLMDRNFVVLRPSVYWTDSRSIHQVQFLKKNYLQLIMEQTLHIPDTIWTLPQLMWIKENQPQIWTEVRHILFAKDYVRYRFTGVYCTDRIEAEGSMLFNTKEMKWSGELCGIIGFPTDHLPPVKDPLDIIGTVTEEAAALSGLKAGTPVLCGTTDTVMEVFASGAISRKQMTVKLATAGRICVITDKPYPDSNLVNYSHIINGLWYPGTATKSCAASFRWYRDTFGGDYRELDQGAETVPAGSEGLYFHPYLAGELTPYADPKLCGSFTGIRSGHTRSHFSRAVMEGTAYSLLDCARTIEKIGLDHGTKGMIIGGGAKSPLWSQIVSDCLGLTLYHMENSDSSFGTAMLAGIASGFFRNPEDAVKRCVKIKDIVYPNAENTAFYQEHFKEYKSIQKALAVIYDAR
jgi:xylulokinase